MNRTPTTEEGLNQYDHLKPEDAIVAAWTEGGRVPNWHRAMQGEVEDAMPLLVRAIKRLVKDKEPGSP